ncbi:MAG: type II secretion system protein GspL [Acidiferrobacterales bacterium]
MVTLLDSLSNNIANVRTGVTRAASRTAPIEQQLELRIVNGWPESGSIDWCLRAGGSVTAHGNINQLSELPAEFFRNPVHVWSSAATCLLTQATIPTRSRQKILRALPYALEDRVLGEPKDSFFAYRTTGHGNLSVAITTHQLLKTWTTLFNEAGLNVVSMVPETLAIPLLSQSWQVFYDAQSCWVRTGASSGFACPRHSASPPYILVSAINKTDTLPETLVVHNPPVDFNQADWEKILGLEVLVEQGSFWDSASPENLSIDLLQEEYSPSTAGFKPVKTFRLAIVSATAWIIIALAVNSYEWTQLTVEKNRLIGEMSVIFKKAFPDQAKLIVDPYRQMQANLARQARPSQNVDGSGFLPLLKQVAPLIDQHRNASLKSMVYTNAALVIEIELSSYIELESLKRTLGDSTSAYTVLRASQTGSTVNAKIKIGKKR